MRFYEITISPRENYPNAFAPVTFTTLDEKGFNNGSALKIDIDLFQTWFHQPAQSGYVRIHGVSFEQINQSSNYNGARVKIKVGMSKGLPFANPAQQGEIIDGTVFQAFGNWQGNLVSLDLIIIPAEINPDVKANLSFIWNKGETLENAIKQTLKNAYPTINVFGTLSQDLVYTETQALAYTNMESFSTAMNNISKQIIKEPNYLGASIVPTSYGFLIADGTATPDKKTKIEFTDLIGNLTWIDTYTVQAKVVMRGDLNVGQYIEFPKGTPVTNTVQSFSQFRNNVSFQGVFYINKIRHVGNSRQADANSWVTIIDAYIPNVLPTSVTAG